MKIIKGTTNDIASSKAFDMLALECENLDNKYIVIVPEKFSMSVEKLLLTKTHKKALVNVEVVTFSRLLKKLVKKQHNYLSSDAGVMVVKKIIIDNLDNFTCFRKIARTAGFAKKIFDTISELKNSDIKPDDFVKMYRNTNNSLSIKLHDIFLIYKEYENFIQNKYVDACDRFSLLSDLVSKNEKIKNSFVYIAGFSSISSSGQNVIKSFLKTAKDVVVACADLSKQENSYIFESEMFESCKSLANELHINPTIVECKDSRTAISSHLSRNLFSYPYKARENKNEIEIFEATTISSEVSFVAEQIRNLILSGARYKNIAVACSSLDTYKDIILNIFDDYDLSIFLDVNESLSSHPLAEFLLSAISIVKKNFSADEVLIFVKNYFSGFSIDEKSSFENYVIEFGINYDKFKSSFVFGKNEKNEAEFEFSEHVRNTLVSKMQRFERILNCGKTSIEFIKAINLLFEDFQIISKVESLSNLLKKDNRPDVASVTDQSIEKINGTLKLIEEFLSPCELNIDEFQSILISGFDAVKISIIPAKLDNIFVGDVSTSKYFDIDYLFVVGANEGVFPIVRDDCGIIVDKELKTMSESASKKIEPTIRTLNKREKFKVFELLQVPKQKLFISYATLTADNEETKSSSVVRDLQKIFYEDSSKKLLIIKKQDDRNRFRLGLNKIESAIDFAREYATPKVGQKKLLSAISDYKNNIEQNDMNAISALYHTLEKRLDENIKNVVVNVNIEKKNQNLKNANNLFFPKNKTSITEIENYFSCPYKHFVEYGLKVKERQDASLKAIDVGNILHKVAECFVCDINEKEKLDSILYDKKVNSIVEKAMSVDKILVASNQYIIKPLKNEAKRMCDALLFQYKNSNFKPIEEGTEIVFGSGRKVPAVEFSDLDIRIEGKIDRVDSCGNFLRVVDYKTGTIDLATEDIYYGKKIQLFVYLKALEKYKNMKSVGAFYLPIKDVFSDDKTSDDYIASYKMIGYFENSSDVVKNMDTFMCDKNPSSKIIQAKISTSKDNIGNFVLNKAKHIVPCDMIGKIVNYIYKISSTAINEILMGNITPSPLKKGNKTTCDYCKFNCACGFSEEQGDLPRNVLSGINFDSFLKEGK